MKINKISYINQYSFKKPSNFKGNLGVASVDKKITKSNPDGTKTVLRQLDCTNPNDIAAGYLKIVGENDNLMKDMRFDKRYNEIRAIEYKDNNNNGFAYIKNGLTISFDKAGQIRNIYLIRKEEDKNTHCVLNNLHGISIHSYDKNNNEIFLKNSNRNKQIEFFLDFTNSVVKLAQSNNLKGSKGLSTKFLYFLKASL